MSISFSNLCGSVAIVVQVMKQLDMQLLKMEEAQHQCTSANFEGRQEKLRQMSEDELNENIAALQESRQDMKTVLFKQQAMQHIVTKVSKLSLAGILLAQSKDVVADAAKLFKVPKSSAGSVASNRGGPAWGSATVHEDCYSSMSQQGRIWDEGYVWKK